LRPGSSLFPKIINKETGQVLVICPAILPHHADQFDLVRRGKSANRNALASGREPIIKNGRSMSALIPFRTQVPHEVRKVPATEVAIFAGEPHSAFAACKTS
jgi:hypothetical protein